MKSKGKEFKITITTDDENITYSSSGEAAFWVHYTVLVDGRVDGE